MRIFAMKAPSIGVAVLTLAAAFNVDVLRAQESSSVGCRDPKLKPSAFQRWVRPDYPKALLAAGQNGVVEVHLDVNEAGKAASIKMGSAPQNDAFEDAVKAVLEYWRYVVPINKACEPLAFQVKARVYFSVEDGKPVVSLEELSSPYSGKACVDALRVLNEREVREKLAQSFPRAARRTSSEGVVYVAIEAHASTGKPRTVDVVRLIDGGSAKREFRNAAILAFSDLRMEPRPGAGPDETVRICRSVSYELSNTPTDQ